MLPSEFAEDLFVEFYNLVAQQKISIQGQDFSPISSFHEKIINGNELTKNQANFLIKLLEKYKEILFTQNNKQTLPFNIIGLTLCKHTRNCN